MLRNTSLAAFPGFSFVGSAQRVVTLADGTEELQICPQNYGTLNEQVMNRARSNWTLWIASMNGLKINV